ncbi:MAG: hypothetical protein ACYSYT_05830 [Planctomycetota bacterium]|jgi:hypothetical protein
MPAKSRKLFVGIISLVTLGAVYLLYNRISRTPPIEIDTAQTRAEDAKHIPDANFDTEIGMIGDVGVGTVQKARYTRLNNQKQVEREFGFDKLLHERADEWEIEKPYMNVFRNNLKCYITAERGTVRIEDAAGQPNPKEGTLAGNVVIHILPQPGSSVRESFIYLDDIFFLSERSRFSTDGPVEFVSEGARMLGTGLELVYNDQQDRLEFLKIRNMKSLTLKTSSQTSLFGPEQTESAGPGPSPEQHQTTSQPTDTTGPKQSRYYNCLFDKNVVIDTPQQLILTDQLSINRILWAADSNAQSGKSDTTGPVSTDSTQPADVPLAARTEAKKSPDQLTDILITCQGGIVVAPQGSSRTPESSAESSADAVSTLSRNAQSLARAANRTTFIAPRIDHSLPTGDTVATGPSELNFYATDFMAGQSNQTRLPVKVTAKKQARFLPKSNQVIFDGDCLCTMLRAEPNSAEKYTLAAPQITIDLADRDAEASSAVAAGIAHLTATGPIVQLATAKTATKPNEPQELLGFTKLKCRRFDYDADQQLMLATGPGLIAADNSRIPAPDAKVPKYGLQKQCYAVVRDFDTLTYYLNDEHVVVNAADTSILIDYFPVVRGKQTRQVAVTTSHIDAFLYQAPTGRTELATLTATGAVTYEDADKQFVGSEMFYDSVNSLITARGSQSQPCLFNGALVDSIKYDLKTGRVKTRIVGPGAFQLR